MRRRAAWLPWLGCVAALLSCRAEPPARPAAAGAAQPVRARAAPATDPSGTEPAAPARTVGSVVSAPPPATTPDWAARHAADEICADCHPDEVEAWGRNPMSHSLHGLTPASPAPAGVPFERTHPIDGLRYAVDHSPALGLRFSARGAAHTTARTARYAVGSGAHTRSYIWQRGEALLMAPLTWYSRPKRWDLSPGYAVPDHPGFDRLTCHADPPALVSGRADRWAGPVPGAIGCSRCHGDARAHAAARSDGGDAPVVNPARLPPDRASAVCEGCHLQGAVRLLRAGRQWADFEPGQPLAHTVAVFVRQGAEAQFGIASHGARLRRSACREPDGNPLTCVTCHRPHPTGDQARADRSAPCRACHSPQAPGGAHPAAAAAHRCSGPAEQDCVRCHMGQGEVDDIPHVAVTDHFIRRQLDTPLPPAPKDAPLVWVADPQVAPTDPGHQRLLGRAYAEAVRSAGQPSDLRRATDLLQAGLAGREAPARAEDLEAWLALAFVAELAGDGPLAKRAATLAQGLAPNDPRAADQLASVLATGDPAAALAALAPALAAAPDTAALHVRASHLHTALGQAPQATAAAEAALALRPDWGPAWLARAFAHLGQGDLSTAREVLRAATGRAPTHTGSWLNRGRLALQAGALDEAQAAWQGAARVADPVDTRTRATAAAGLARVALARDDPQAAVQHLDAALTYPAPVPGVLAATGAMALHRGRADDARRALQAHLAQDPADPLALADLARALTALGDAPGAAAATARAAGLRRALGLSRPNPPTP